MPAMRQDCGSGVLSAIVSFFGPPRERMENLRALSMSSFRVGSGRQKMLRWVRGRWRFGRWGSGLLEGVAGGLDAPLDCLFWRCAWCCFDLPVAVHLICGSC